MGAWELTRSQPNPNVLGQIGVVRREVAQLGWGWECGPWQWERPGDTPLPITGGPQGFFDHAIRHGIRAREARQLAQRRPECAGAEHCDRRAVFAALRENKAHQMDAPHDRGTIEAVVTGAVTTAVHLHRAGRVPSDRCPYCTTGAPEALDHLYFHCPAWAEARKKYGWAEGRVDTTGWAPVTEPCGVLTIPDDEQRQSGWLPPPASLARVPTHGPDLPVDRAGRVTAYTDGSGLHANFAHHLRCAGFGIFWGDNDPRNVAEPLSGPWQSARRAEVSAVTAAARAFPDRHLLISTDSQYSWERACLMAAGYPADPFKEHYDLLEELERAIRQRPVHAPVRFEKVKAHTSEAAIGRTITRAQRDGNAGADTLADQGSSAHTNYALARAAAETRTNAQDHILHMC